MENLREELEKFKLVLGLIKEGSNKDVDMFDELSAEVRAITRDVTQQYKDTTFHDIISKVNDDPSIKYFGMDWKQTFEIVDGFISLLLISDPANSDLEDIIVFLNRVEREVFYHIIAAR